MKVILLQDVSKVGHKYEVKEVADGFARNVLLAKKQGIVATKENLAKLDKEIKKRAEEKKLKDDILGKGMKEIDGLEVKLAGKASPEGHLFAGIRKDEIIKAVHEAKNIELESDWIELDKPLKSVGEHEVIVKVGDKKAKLKVIIEAE